MVFLHTEQFASSYSIGICFLFTPPGTSDASRSEGHSGDMAAVVVPVLFLLLLGVCGGLVVLYLRHRRLQNNFTAFANSHYNSRLGSAIFSSGDELGETKFLDMQLPAEVFVTQSEKHTVHAVQTCQKQSWVSFNNVNTSTLIPVLQKELF